MTTDRDPFDLLAAADPARAAAPFDPHSERGRRVLERATAAGEPRRRRRRPGPRFLVVVVGVGAIGTAAAGAFINSRQPTRTQAAACYETSSLPSPSTFAVSTDDRSAIDSCWRVWRNGKFSPTPTPPRLVACVLEPGSIGVFPGGPEVCARLRRPLAPDNVRADPDVAELQDRLVAVRLRSDCLMPTRARQIAADELGDVGLDGWSVEGVAEAGFTEAKPCATFSVDEVRRKVRLVPTAPENG